MTKCPTCGKLNVIVNQCRCDPNNLPTFNDPSAAYGAMAQICASISQMASIHHGFYWQGQLNKLCVRQLEMECERLLSLAKSCQCLIRSKPASDDQGSWDDLAASGGIVGAP